MANRTHRMLCLAALAAGTTLLQGCATTYNSAGDRYISVWPFIGSRNPDLQLNYPVQTPQNLQLGHDPDPFYLISPQPPVDPRVTSPYSQAPAPTETRLAAVSDNAVCADSCESKENSAETSLAERADAGDRRLVASR
jgi:hypothetical protein